jgi:hypothetical protein
MMQSLSVRLRARDPSFSMGRRLACPRSVPGDLPNARHHPPRTQRSDGQVVEESRAIGGRVYAVVK